MPSRFAAAMSCHDRFAGLVGQLGGKALEMMSTVLYRVVCGMRASWPLTSM